MGCRDGDAPSAAELFLELAAAIPTRHYLLASLLIFSIFLYSFLELHLVGDALRGFRGNRVFLTFNPDSDVYRVVVSQCRSLHGRYLATPWLSSPHLQTAFLNFFTRDPPAFTYTRQIFRASDGGTIALDWLLVYDGCFSDSNKVIPKDDTTPIVVMIPGLTSDSTAPYIKHMVYKIARRGWNAVVSNHRGLGGVPITGVVRARVMTKMLYALYLSLPEFQHRRLYRMRLTFFLSAYPIWVDVALMECLRRRWSSACSAFIFPWGHMIPTLEDVAWITGLRVHGSPVTGTTLGDYRGLAQQLLGYEDRTPGALRSVKGSALTDLIGAKGLMKKRSEDMDEYLARVRGHMTERWAQEEGAQADRELRVFLMFLMTRVLFATKSSTISLRYLTLLEDLEEFGQMALGAAVLGDLFYHLSTHSGETGISGYSPLLQVWAYYRLPLHLPRFRRVTVPSGDQARRVPLMARWTPIVSQQTIFEQREHIRRGLDETQDSEIVWRPYQGESMAGQPWVVEAQHLFRCDLYLHALNIVEPLYVSLVMRTIGLHQSNVDFAALEKKPRRSVRYSGFTDIDWADQYDDEFTVWIEGGSAVVEVESTDEIYLYNFHRHYAAQLRQRGASQDVRSDREEDLQARLDAANLELGLLRGVNAELREELQRARSAQGASTSRAAEADPAELQSLRERLQGAVARAETAESDVQERIASLQTSLDALTSERDEAAMRATARISELERQLVEARASSGGGDPRLAIRLELIEADRAADRAEIARLRTREIELEREAGGWRRQAEYLDVRDRERSQRSHISRSHRTSQVSRPSPRVTERVEEGSGEGGGEGGVAPGPA